MDPALKLITILIIAFEISFTQNLILNFIIIAFSLLILILNKIKIKSLLHILIIPIIPAIGIYSSQLINGSANYGIILATRVYAYVFLGATFTKTSSIEDLAFTLEQNFNLPSKFAYGVLGAFNLTETIKKEIKQIKMSATMRNLHLTFLSPTLYFKSIMSALNWSNLLAEGMTSHLFVENNPRTHFKIIHINKFDYVKIIITIVVVQLILIAF
ncbi:energy-coupling factor transporter transmembrane component T [Apilactobacillus quenuiae]|uniref:energy-coupling factor transporter transmembrane component T n=1 Tax=Apilactobacillus quenuiae TaxID=2008377 RepID=UPI000D014DBE|nr:energy-coupling factor transporter transmembrane component T [Apilactobacillus quenuiae]